MLKEIFHDSFENNSSDDKKAEFNNCFVIQSK